MAKSIIEQLQEAANNPTELDRSLLTTKTNPEQIQKALNRLNLAKTDLDDDSAYRGALRDVFNYLNIDEMDLVRALYISKATLDRYRKSLSAPNPERKLMHYNAIEKLHRAELYKHKSCDI